MHGNQETVSVKDTLVVSLVLLNAIVLQKGFVAHQMWYVVLCISLPLLLIALVYRQMKH